MDKDPAAVNLGRKRWKGSTPEERSEFASESAKARWANTTPEERAAIAKKLVAARRKKRTNKK